MMRRLPAITAVLASLALTAAIVTPADAGPTVKKRTWETRRGVAAADLLGWNRLSGGVPVPEVSCPAGDRPLLMALRATPSSGARWARGGLGPSSLFLTHMIDGWDLLLYPNNRDRLPIVIRVRGDATGLAEWPAGLAAGAGADLGTLFFTVSSLDNAASRFEFAWELTFACGDAAPPAGP